MAIARLASRPEAKTPTIEKLLQWVDEGRVRLPRFQRALRWRSEHIKALFDSIYRGFPIGVLLLAQQPAEAEEVALGPVRIHAAARPDALYVVDGQQRITALAGALLHAAAVPRGDMHAVWFDLVTLQFQRLAGGRPPPTWLPLNVALDSFKLLNWLNDWPLRAEQPGLVQAAIKLGQELREYQVPVYVVEGASEEALRVIFKRTNTSGRAMRAEEVFDALQGRIASAPLRDACTRLANLGFGDIEERWLLDCVKAVNLIDPKRRFAQDENLVEPEHLTDAERAVAQALAFLAQDAGIPHVGLLPYALALVVLAKFFHQHARPTARTRSLLSRWLWRGALSGVHSNNSNVKMRELLRVIGPDEGPSVQALLQHVPKELDSWPDPLRTWNPQSAQTRALAVAMLQLEPRDPESGQPYDVSALVPSPLAGFHDVQLAGRNALARYMFLATGKRATARRTLSIIQHGAAPLVLESHAISPAALKALRNNDLPAFLELRAQLLNERLRPFFAERVGAGASDRPAIADIISPHRRLLPGEAS